MAGITPQERAALARMGGLGDLIALNRPEPTFGTVVLRHPKTSAAAALAGADTTDFMASSGGI